MDRWVCASHGRSAGTSAGQKESRSIRIVLMLHSCQAHTLILGGSHLATYLWLHLDRRPLLARKLRKYSTDNLTAMLN